ncbi:MAG: hypothetical protein KA116_10830 [Proteobacteria bacterium]|nr:hypothetical protein [Pseudomonadota bacterium]
MSLKELDKRKKKGEKQNPLAIYAGLGMSFSTEILVLTLTGWWAGKKLDVFLGKKDFYAYIGVVSLFILAIVHVIRSLLILQKRLDKDEES